MQINWDLYPNFHHHEFSCTCCGVASMDPTFLNRLQELRTLLAFPLYINSGFRCAKHNRAVGGGLPHTLGKAADIAIAGRRAHKLIDVAIFLDFSGIGVRQHGLYDRRFIHLDTLTSQDFEDNDVIGERPWIWSYT